MIKTTRNISADHNTDQASFDLDSARQLKNVSNHYILVIIMICEQ